MPACVDDDEALIDVSEPRDDLRVGHLASVHDAHATQAIVQAEACRH